MSIKRPDELVHNREDHSDIDQSLLTTDSVQFSKVTVGDFIMENDWKFTEHPDHGVILKSPEGRIFKLTVEELK